MKNVIVTGASGGIGLSIANKFANNGCKVLAGYNNTEIKTENENIIPFKFDALSIDSIKRFVSKATYEFDKIDVLVVCHGVSCDEPFLFANEEVFDKTFDINVKGSFFVSQLVSKEMTNASSKGSIVFISSMWGMQGAANESIYSMTKASIINLTKSLSKELSTYGIRVNSVAPGAIDTKMLDIYGEEGKEDIIEKTPLKRLGTPEDVANAVYFLSSDDASFVTGQTLVVDGGFSL